MRSVSLDQSLSDFVSQAASRKAANRLLGLADVREGREQDYQLARERLGLEGKKLGIEGLTAGLDNVLKGQQIKSGQALEELRQGILAETDPEKMRTLQDKYLALTGKDRPAEYDAIHMKGGSDPNNPLAMLPDRAFLYNRRTGEQRPLGAGDKRHRLLFRRAGKQWGSRLMDRLFTKILRASRTRGSETRYRPAWAGVARKTKRKGAIQGMGDS